MADMFVEWLDDAFGEAGYVLELRDVPGDSALWGAIRRAIDERERPFVLMPIEVHAMPYLPLDERDTESPGGRAEKARSIAKHRGYLDRRGRIEFERLQDADSVLAGLDTLAAMLRSRWGAGISALDNPAMLQFQRHVLPRLQAEGRLRMMQMLVDRRPIAVCNLVTGGSAASRWCGYLLAGYDREWAGRIHLGRLALVASMQLAEREGAREFDFLKGPERFKYYWPVRERVSIDANLYSGTFRTQVTRARDEGRHAAVALFKSVRGLIPSLPQ
jgi:CelD/BcsL family acetyltransferase involved in cellulose biosynthesis